MRKIILLLLATILMLPAMLHAQGRVISGTIRDAGGILPGASVVEKGVTGNGTVSDMNGKFTLTLKGTSQIVIVRFIGYNILEYNVAGKTANMDITLTSSQQGLDEVIVVGYGKTTRITNTGAVSSIAAADIRTVPTANVQNALQGKLPGFFSQQSSGQPGRDASDFFIRGISSLNADGNKPLIIVDDIEYTYDQLQQINVNEIETISILKDASTTAIYGVKGANGVLVVTTRRGKVGRPQVNLRAESGLQSPTRTPKFLNSYDAATLINQAVKNDNASATLPFTNADLAAFQSGNDPYGHPDVNWYNAIFDKMTYQVNTNVDISGGTDNVKYFISGGALDQNGLLKSFPDPRGAINNNYYFNRYNFRSNLDLKANKTLNLRLDVTTRFSNLNQPNVGAASALSDIYDFRIQTPFTAPFLNPDGSYAYAFSQYNPAHLATINARIATSGYSNAKRSDYNMLFNATQKLDAVTDGLSLTGRVAYASSEQYTRGAGNYGNIPSYHYDPVKNTTTKNPNAPYVLPNQYYIGDINVYQTNVNVQAYANYDRSFGRHHVSGLALFNQTAQTFYTGVGNDRVGVPVKFQGLSVRGSYEYAQKYLLDINVARNGSDRFAAKNRFGIFPAVSAGYNISNEPFFKNIFKNIGLLKFRASYGLVGSDVAPGNQYIYEQKYNQGGGYIFGSSANNVNTYFEGSLANGDVVWEKQRELDLGVDINMLKDNKLTITFDYFYNVRYDQLIFPNSIPQVLGVGLPAINLGRTQNTGVDGSVGYHSNVGKVTFGTNFVFSYAKNKVLERSEALPAYPWLARTGQPINQPFGYHYVGYYTAAEAAAIAAYKATNQNSNFGNTAVPAPNAASAIQAGDLKYDDLNKDGIIDESDQRAIGLPNLATTTLGFTLQLGYKGFSASILFQGSFNYSFIITGTGIEPFQSQFQPIHQQAWTPANAANAQFPRLTQVSGTINSPSSYPSDYWLLNAHYIRLKTVDLGYQFPTKMLPFKINNARIYLSAYNLFTWDNATKYQQDPEIRSNTAGDAYINQRVVNLGLQLGF